MILQDISWAIDLQQETRWSHWWSNIKQTTEEECFQRAFWSEQRETFKTKSPNIEKWVLYGTDDPVKPLKSASSAHGGVNTSVCECLLSFFFGVCDTLCSAAACQTSRLQILWQIGMLRRWFQPGYINPPPPPPLLSTLCTSRQKSAAAI